MSFITGEKSDIPTRLLPQLATLMAQLADGEGKETGHSAEYFLERLGLPTPPEYGSVIGLALIDNKTVGWGHLTWRKDGKRTRFSRPEMYIIIDPKERRKGYGTQMCRNLLEKVPPHIDVLDVPAMKSSSGARYVQTKLGGTVVDERKRGVLEIRQLQLEEVSQEAKRQRQLAEKLGFELRFMTHETIEQKVDFSAFVKMVAELESDDSLAEWTIEETTEKEEEYRTKLELEQKRESQFLQYVAVEKETGELAGYTQIVTNFERNKKQGWDSGNGVLARFRGIGLGLALNCQMLERLLRETEVTRWITENMYSSEYLLKMFTELGFEYYITNCIHEVTREAWEAFLEEEDSRSLNEKRRPHARTPKRSKHL
ncbi:MAG: GNAT family N-acetyltransferase [Candidatus Bathyarchaeota archaeon]|nr:MAG: GNAT family N-acetyltransferase [Candidatus Bathyarchaeota archaeon]